MSEFKLYDKMESILHTINSDYVALSDKDIKRNNFILSLILENLAERMKSMNSIFNRMFKYTFYGGSYYDGLKVHKPDEYDMDLVFLLPLTIESSDIPGFVHARVQDYRTYEMFCEKGTDYLNTMKVISWMQEILQKVLNQLPYENNRYSLWDICHQHLFLKIRNSGPAWTLKITGCVENLNVHMDIDLVACFLCDDNQWPVGYKSYPFRHSKFFIVPKSPKLSNSDNSKYWRLSFQEQERDILINKGKIKPALRLLKKMRLTQNHPISSYSIKTIGLWEADIRPEEYWFNKSLSYTFMHFLKLYRDHLIRGEIKYFWNSRNNLIDGFHKDTYYNIGNRMEYIIKDIERKINPNPEIVMTYILTAQELSKYEDIQYMEAEVVKEEPASSCIII